MAIAAVPAATLPESAFLSALGTPAARMVPPQTGSLAQRAIEEWERNLCDFFFRPTPSWLPPGRSTRSIACCKLGFIS